MNGGGIVDKSSLKDWVDYYDRRAEIFKDPLVVSEMILRNRKVGQEFLRREKSRIIGLLQPDRNEELLDLGCCAGVCLSLIAEEFSECTGVDLAKNALARARRRLPRVRFIQDDITRLQSIRSRSFLYVTAYGVLHYMKPADQISFFKAIERVCRKGARVALMRIPNARWHADYQEWRASQGKKVSAGKGAPRWFWIKNDFIHGHLKRAFDIVSVPPPSDVELPSKAFFDVVLIRKD